MANNISLSDLIARLVSSEGGPPPPPPFSPGGPPVVMPGGGTYTPPSAPPSYSPPTVTPPSYSSPSYNPSTWAQQHGGTYTPPSYTPPPAASPSQPNNPYSVLYTKLANLRKERSDLETKRNAVHQAKDIAYYNGLISKLNAEITATQAKITDLTSKEVQATAGAPKTVAGPEALDPTIARQNMIKIMGQDLAQYFSEQKRLAGLQDYEKIIGRTDTALQAEKQSASKIMQSAKGDIAMYRQIALRALQNAQQAKARLERNGLNTGPEDRIIAAAQNELNVLSAAEGLISKGAQNITDRKGIENILSAQAATTIPPTATTPSSAPPTATPPSTQLPTTPPSSTTPPSTVSAPPTTQPTAVTPGPPTGGIGGLPENKKYLVLIGGFLALFFLTRKG